MSTENDTSFDFKTLQAFQAAMACGSMTMAAKQLGIGQPAVTRLVKDLEQAVGFPLFHRNGPRISPTDRGLQFYEETQRLMANLRQLHERAEAIRNERLSALDIAATPTMAGGLLGTTLRNLGEELPDHIHVQTLAVEYVVRALRGRTADFGIAAYPLDHMGLTRHVICESRLVAAIPDTPEAAARFGTGPLPLSVFASTRLITVGNSFRIRASIEQAFEMQGIEPRREMSSNSSLNAVMAARAGLGVAIVDPVTAFGIPVQGVRILPIETAIPYFWGLLSDANRLFSPAQTRFFDAFRAACVEVVPQCILHDADDAATLKRISQILRK